VALCDVERLRTLGQSPVRALADRLRAAEVQAFAALLARSGRGLDDALRAPMRIWHARRSPEPAATFVRLFMLHDPVAPAEASRALGDLSAFRDVGMIEDSKDGLVSPVHLAFAADIPCFGDPPGTDSDAVMPLGGATLDLVRAVLAGGFDAALDVGCGAGAVALHLSRNASRVVATDIHERAIDWARFNAALSNTVAIDFRCGDLFDTVRGERFDRIAAHPPFVAIADGERHSHFVHGGLRGDELALRLIDGATGHLSPKGRLVAVADWPVATGDSLHDRIRRRLGDRAVGVLVLLSPLKNVDEYCVLHAAVECAGLGPDFVRSSIRKRNHYDRLGLSGVAFGVVIVEPSPAAWTSLVAVRHSSDVPVTAPEIDRLLAAHSLAHRGDLSEARLRLPPGASLVDQPVPDSASPAVVVRLPASRPEWPPVLDAATAHLVRLIAQAPTVGRAVVEATRPSGRVPSYVVQAAREALLSGVLEPYEP
jgi:SAM-dependent methyltransferase